MKRTLLGNVSFYIRDLVFSSLARRPNSVLSPTPLYASTIPTFRSYASRSDPFNEAKLLRTEKSDSPAAAEELKRRIEKFYEGDADALPSIFEAILERKLTGSDEKELDDELMEVIRGKGEKPLDVDCEDEDEENIDIGSDGSEEEDDDVDSDSEEWTESDAESS